MNPVPGNDRLGMGVILISGSDQERHPENVKSEFVTEMDSRDMPGEWGVKLHSLSFDNTIINYEGEEEETKVDDDAKIDNQPTDVEIKIGLMHKGRNGTWKSTPVYGGPTEGVIQREGRDLSAFCRNITMFLQQRFMIDVPPITLYPPPTDECSVMKFVNSASPSTFSSSIPLEPLLSRCRDVPEMIRVLNKVAQYLNPALSLEKDRNTGHLKFAGPSSDWGFSITSSKQTNLQKMLKLLGFGINNTTVAGSSVTSAPWTSPEPLAVDRPDKDGKDVFLHNFSSDPLIHITVTISGGGGGNQISSINRDVNINDLYMSESITHLSNLLFNDVFPELPELRLYAVVNTAGEVKLSFSARRQMIASKIEVRIRGEVNGFIPRLLGLDMEKDSSLVSIIGGKPYMNLVFNKAAGDRAINFPKVSSFEPFPRVPLSFLVEVTRVRKEYVIF